MPINKSPTEQPETYSYIQPWPPIANQNIQRAAALEFGKVLKVAGSEYIPYTGFSPDVLAKLKEQSTRLEVEDQPSPEYDDATSNSPFSSIDAALDAMSQDRSIDAQTAANTYGTTTSDLGNRAASLASTEKTLGVAVGVFSSIFGPKPASIFETFREEPRQTYAELATSIRAANNIASYRNTYNPTFDIAQPTSAGRGTRAAPSSVSTFAGFNVDKQPVGRVPTGFEEEQDYNSRQGDRDAEAAAAAQQAATTGMGKAFGSMEAGPEGDPSTGGLSGGQGDSPGGSGTDGAAEGPGGDWNTGGRVGALIQHLQTGGEIENAETNLGNADVPIGVVSDADGAPSPFRGGTGVEDDLEMEVDAGSYVLNAESVQLIGISDINAVIRDAYSIAAALGKEVPADYDPQNKVPIRISNGEAVIPKALVDIIGLDKLEKWNQKGLQLRKQKEKFTAEQQQQQPPQQQQVASEAPMQQQMGQLMDRGGSVAMSQAEARDELYKEEEDTFFNVLTGEKDTLTKLRERYGEEEEGASSGAESIVAPVTSIVKEPVNEPTTEILQKIFRTDDSGPDPRTGKPQSNINKDITVEESSGVEKSEDNIMAAQVAKTSVMPKSAFDRMKYTDDYDVVFGHELYTSKLSKKRITRMTVKEIFTNQDRLKKATEKETHASTGHGPYQINKNTLEDQIERYNYSPDTLFTPAFQDQLAINILKESRVFKFIEDPANEKHNLTLVQNKLAKRWAALPTSGSDKKSAHKNQEAALTSTAFRQILKRVQELGEAKGIPLLLKTIRKAETALR